MSEASTLTVRRFAPDEWQLYRELRLGALQESPEAFGSTYAHEAGLSESDWASRLSRGAHSTQDLPLVAEVNEEPCGLAWVRLEGEAPAIARLYQMWVVPARRRQGVGRALLEAAVAWARAAGARAVALDVTCDNADAIGLYASVGFIPTGARKPLRPGSAVQSQSMQLRLV